MNTVKIEDYAPQDYDALCSMIFHLYEDEGEPMTASKIQKTIQQAQHAPEYLQIKLLKEEAMPIGYAILSAFWSNEYGGMVLIIDELYILPAYRNKGIATHFLNELTNSQKYVAYSLEVFAQNTSALALYKRLGFEVVERFFMKKKL